MMAVSLLNPPDLIHANVAGLDYDPLPDPKKYIRLIQILPDKDDDAPIVCNMQVLALDHAHEHVAISYLWGDPTPTYEITMNGRKMLIGKNCRYALWQRRQYQRPGTWTWIDALCINQGDLDEKSQQVEIMGDIYHHAERVVVSLEDGDDIGECVASYALQLASGTLALHSETAADYVECQSQRDYWNPPRIPLVHLDNEIRTGLGEILIKFCYKTYWSRVWGEILKATEREQFSI